MPEDSLWLVTVETAVVNLCNDDVNIGNERGDEDDGAGNDRSEENQRPRDRVVGASVHVNNEKWNVKRYWK